ncbi:MAG: putative peptidoglycan glycosyltransferase FtsW [Ancalomicrobiaceae bacterium]|nr:putative peptidoglycan glycosyltransferase FtsW [Ancalomicrobiaceae bacterium]
MIDRMDRSSFAQWWWTVDRALLAAFLILIVLGLVLSFAASPAVAERIGAGTFYFIKRHALFVTPAAAILVGCSFMGPRDVRRAAVVMLAVGLVLLVATLFFGQEVKGSRRWITLAVLSIQPSELVKPAFIIVASWLFSERMKRPEVPGNLLAMLLLAVVVALLLAEPDVGQTILTVVSWGAIFFVAGLQVVWIIGLGAAGVGAGYLAYVVFPHVHARVDRFFAAPVEGPARFASDNFQVQTAIDAFTNGSWFGRGPGEGTVKKILPDSHTDFVMAVLGEEFGIIACILLVTLFAFVVGRALWFALKEEDPFIRLSVVGLATEFGVQAGINMAVNLHLMPAKGMTLPFISYGGSSMLSLAFGMGCLLALTRRRPQATRMVSAVHAD